MGLVSSALLAALLPQAAWAAATRLAAVEDGILRWQDDHSEVSLFGVNYCVPFALDYQSLKARGLDHRQAIREDVAHFERLGLSAIRLHCWDREISDQEGNLRDNEHLRLLDYLIAQCKERGIYSVMTPIAWWHSPEGGGFSDLYTMQQMTTDLRARRAQCQYLRQYLEHVNRYTGLAYKDDPAIVAIELINEPLYPPDITEERVTEYINALVQAVRETGCKKPVFYNCWGGHHRAAAVSLLDGVSFGWYPTGLVSGGMLRRNYLPMVNDYPEMRDPLLVRKAKIVYEFDAADVHGSVMYPAMARAFRSGGAQIATQFQYDPLCIADGNPDWQTHHLNLVYTPHKAISFAIAAEAFRRIPRLQTFGPYPESCKFGEFRLSFEQDLSEFVAPDAFFYSNDTDTAPTLLGQTRIAGCGSSPVVRYQGTGAYFLDRLSPGVWKLHVYPDAVMVADPYAGGSHEKVRALWRKWGMEVRLWDLGPDFTLMPCDAQRTPRPGQQAQNGAVTVTPGEYLLVRRGVTPPERVAGVEFIAPPSSAAPPAVCAANPCSWREGRPYEVRASVAATDDPECVLHFRPASAREFQSIPMQRTRAYEYRATVSAELMRPGKAAYCISLRSAEGARTFPGGEPAEPIPTAQAAVPPLVLLRIAADTPPPLLRLDGREGEGARSTIIRGRDEGTYALRLEADGFGAPPSCAATEWKVGPLPDHMEAYNTLRILARGGPDTSGVEISLVQSDGNAFGTVVPLAPVWHETAVPLTDLRPMWNTRAAAANLALLDHVTVVFGAWLYGDLADRRHTVDLQTVELCREPRLWEVLVRSADAPVVLIEPAGRPIHLVGRPATHRPVPGMDPDKMALRLAVDGFDAPPDATGYRLNVPEETRLWREEMARAKSVIIKARAGQPWSNKLELVLVEEDGAPWGVNVPLTKEWQAIRIPLSDLWYFAHWHSLAKDRGGPGDHVHPENIESVNICFGAWLYGENRAKPHAIEVQEVSLSEK